MQDMRINPADPSVEERSSPLSLFRTMALVRAFETRVARLFRDSDIPGFIHTSVGQEAVATGVCAALEPQDYVVSTHRGHGHCLAKGADVDAAMAELFGKASGLCKGKGGSMHIADAQLGILGANAIVGAGLPLATGAALSSRLLGQEAVAVAFFGEGAVNQGAFHESLNLAAIWELPALFVCENNVYAEFTDSRTTSLRASVVAAARAYGVEGEAVDGNDVEAVLEAACALVAAARSGGGPRLLEAHTYRWQGHYEGDPQTYKPAAEVEAWQERDPLRVHGDRLVERGIERARLDEIVAEAEARVESAERTARAAPYPELAEVFTDVLGD
jgi:TPP-dependent pyruvate/acetoin dehydrogenase alpha subunit